MEKQIRKRIQNLLFAGIFSSITVSATSLHNNPPSTFPDYGKAIAFPGAEGYGKNATGGRFGEIYHVTNLNDSGKGSFRDAVSQPNRIVLFDVAGIINLKSAVSVARDITIAGQSAPGDGIVLYGANVSFSGSDNIICRYLRIRMGINGPKGKDAAGVAYGQNMIFDHLSVTWGRDENFSINHYRKGHEDDAPRNITIQNSIMGQGLHPHSCGGLIQTKADNGITLYRNLYIDNKTRNPKVKGLNQFVNNVVYNWGAGAAYNMGGSSQSISNSVLLNNYFIEGACINFDGSKYRPTPPIIGYNENVYTYIEGNYIDDNRDGKLNGTLITNEHLKREKDNQVITPVFLKEADSKHPQITNLMSAKDAYQWITQWGGASLPARDEVDTYLIEEMTSLGTKGQIIQSEIEQTPTKGPGKIKQGTLPADSDHDGMPDEFEDKYGLDKNNPADAMQLAANGYTNIENYLFLLEQEKMNK